MPGTNYTVATRSQLTGEGVRQLRWETRRLEKLRGANDENHQPRGEPNTSRLDTAPTPTTQERRRSEKAFHKATEIYFSPLTLKGSQVELSDPLPTPELTPTQASYATVEAAWRAATTEEHVATACSSPRRKYWLRAQDLDRLVVALANAPMMQRHVEKATRDPGRGNVRDGPSLFSARSSLRDVSPPKTERAATSRSPSNPADLTRATQATFAGIAIVEPKVDSPALRFWSHHHIKNGKLMHVGKERYLNVPYDEASKANCRLRVETVAIRSERSTVSVFMQLVSPVLVRKTGKVIYTMITEFDVTESFRKAAFIELVGQAGCNPEDMVLEAKTTQTHSSPSSVSIDWCTIADDLQSSSDIASIVDTAVETMAHLGPETCAMQTLTLMSELERIRRKHQDFVIVRAHERYENGVPSRMSVPWLSEHLDVKGNHTPRLPSQATATFRLHIIDITVKRSMQSEPFAATVPLAGEEKSVHFVPILDGESENNVGWVCFLRDINDVGL